ncbi:MAG TPA: NAD(P)-dependent oxidoreductase [Burkholderiales bacterium]|jgi:3-hydroxyisobutyrate dehydrogenase-like beta-hydroxyacid dehydrogenase
MACIAFIGLGVMGYPMAGHLKKKGGHDVTVFNRTSAKAAQWVKDYGGRSAPTPREAARDCDFVMMCVGNDDDVRAVAHGKDGALAGMKQGAVLVDHTTASAFLARELHARCRERGVGFVDAPVSGGQAGAVNGQLGIMCGGDARDFEQARPVLEVYARMCALIGGPGSGQLTKMVNQVAIVGQLQGLAEALNFGKRAGLDMEKVVSVISKGAAQSWQLENRWKTMVEGRFEGFGFACDWMRKDLNIALAEAKKNGAYLPGTAVIEQYYGRLSAAGHGRWDNTALIDLLARD